MTINDLLQRLEGVRRSGAGWSARCPAHPDARNSLSVDGGQDGRILVKCFAGCDAEAVVSALGLTLADLMPEREPARRLVATYDYTDETGTLLYQVLRYYPKTFKQRRPDGYGGWTWNLNGVPRVLYGLPAIKASGTRRVLVVEGEKDCEALKRFGFIATTNAGGAGKWKPELSDALKNRHVIVLPDNDETGRRHAELIGRSLRGLAASIRVLTLPNLPPKGDVSDWLDAGGTRDELKRLAKASLEWTPPPVSNETRPGPVLVSLDSVRAEIVDWLWCDRVPFGKLTLLDGDPGLGKSTLALEIAARVTRGEALPGGEASRPLAVVILSAEDGLADTIRPRLDAAGADASLIRAFTAVRGEDGSEEFPSLDNLEPLEAAIASLSARLVIVDPLMAYLGAKTNSWRDQDVRRALAPLAAIAERHRVAVLIIRHLNKGNASAIYRGGGSIGIIGAARSALLVAKDPGEDGRRIVAPVKSNLCAPPPALAFRLRATASGAAGIEWEAGTADFTADSLLAAQTANLEDRSALEEAKAFLEQALAGGARPQRELFTEARGAGISEMTLRRAKTVLGIKPRKIGLSGPWIWEAPSREAPEGDHVRPKVITPPNDHLQGPDDHLRPDDEPEAAPEDNEEEVAL